ncbi:hypothetical protein WAI453_013196 [Rhynchosporium graminicola]
MCARAGAHKGHLVQDATYRLPTASIGVIISEGIITDGPSSATDVDASMIDEMAVGSRREDTAQASTIEDTILVDIETSIRDEASTQVNILDHESDKATVHEDSAIVAMDDGVLIPVEKTGDEELSVVTVFTGNVDHDTIIVEEEDARFEIAEERPRVEMIESRAAGGSIQPIMIEDDDEQIDEAPAQIHDLVRRDVRDEDMESEYLGDNSVSRSPRKFYYRSSRLQGRLNQLQANHVGYRIKVLERLIEQIESEAWKQ